MQNWCRLDPDCIPTKSINWEEPALAPIFPFAGPPLPLPCTNTPPLLHQNGKSSLKPNSGSTILYIYICKYMYIYIIIYIYKYTHIYTYSVYPKNIPIAIQWVGRTPWFCKYNSPAWPPDGCPSITNSMGLDLSRHGFHYKIKAQSLFRKHS